MEEEAEEERRMYARGQSARDRMQGRLYANAGREFDQDPTFPLREGVCTTVSTWLYSPTLRIFLCAGIIPTTPCKCEKGIVRVTGVIGCA